MSIVDLPPELWRMVLCELDSPAELYSFIRATKPFYEIFRESQISILAPSLRNAVPAEIGSDFLLVDRTQQTLTLEFEKQILDWDRHEAELRPCVKAAARFSLYRLWHIQRYL
ncbi:hypothetical protein P154DRAFT_570689 [Amniculicola lignicola CBS 123094]|uniref:F-box domain-containing protein n=1 Tax=Amniculicola lignicola CBS 123094 TaxID=1392246 RepID=A0A6A5WW60_9PLEO|nr:hypothetical protein P154DRAFT_570689 [Amniculicola lignicola CBS 123094]